MRTAGLVTTLLALGSFACAPQSGAMSAEDEAAIATQVRQSYDVLTRAMAQADVEATMAFMAPNVILSFHGLVVDREGLEEALHAFYDPVSGQELGAFDPIQVDVLGPGAAVVTSANSQTTSYQDGTVSPLAMVARTMVWRQTPEGWRVVHGHISRHNMESSLE